MKRIYRHIFAVLLICFIVATAFAGNKGGRYFSNQDLGKYNKTYQNRLPENPITEKDADNSGYNYSDNEKTEKELKRYVVPYAGVARRIIIPVTFNNSLTVPMLLDTGAPGMHISLRLASKLGILDNDDSKLWITAGGIGGRTPAIFTVIETIRVGEIEDQFIPTVISKSVFSGFEGLIGMDFMGNYSMKVDTMERAVVFEELPQSSSMPAGHDEMWWRTTFNNFKSMKTVWEQQKEAVSKQRIYTENEKRLKMFVEGQYEKADDLLNRLDGYASQNSVPLEWR